MHKGSGKVTHAEAEYQGGEEGRCSAGGGGIVQKFAEYISAFGAKEKAQHIDQNGAGGSDFYIEVASEAQDYGHRHGQQGQQKLVIYAHSSQQGSSHGVGSCKACNYP